MNIKDILGENQFMTNIFNQSNTFNKIKNISTTIEIAKPTPIDEILEKLKIKVEYKSLPYNELLTTKNKQTIFEINSYNSNSMQQYSKALLLSDYLQPNANHAQRIHFAINLIMPEKLVKLALTQNDLSSKNVIEKAAKQINVSTETLTLRLAQLGLLD